MARRLTSNVTQSTRFRSTSGQGMQDYFGPDPVPFTGDPAFQPPGDPLRDTSALRARAKVIYREVPNVSVAIGWDVNDVRSALADLVVGNFDAPAQLTDAIASDSRVQSALKSRSGGLLGAPVSFHLPRRFRKDERAKKCMRRFEDHWQHMGAEPALLDLLETSHSLSFAYSQILWDTTSSKKEWRPYLEPFGARYSYYHWLARRYVAITQDGQVPIEVGQGNWLVHAPYGLYRGWMRGALRALAQWWLARSYALRDFAGYCEQHGFPMLLADTPFGADTGDVAAYQASLQNLGQSTCLQLPGSVDVNKYGKYNLRYLEPQDAAWQSFKALIETCNTEITLVLLGQNLTSEIKEGSMAAARVHADVRQAILESDARAFERTIYVQVLRPYAALNFGDADLAPYLRWDVTPADDYEMMARTFLAFGQGLNQARLSGLHLQAPERFAKTLGLDLGKIDHVDPTAIAARVAADTGTADELGQSDGSPKPKKSDKDAPFGGLSFAQRNASFLADLKDLEGLNLRPTNLSQLAALHGVPVPTDG